MSSRVMSCPGQQRIAPAEARRQRDLGVALGEQRVADHVVERAVEVAAPIKQRFRPADDLAQHLLVRRADRGDLRGHLGVRRNRVGEDRDELVAIVLHLAAAHVEIEPRDELAVAARGDQQRLADLDHVRQRVVGVPGQDHVDAAARGRRACGRRRSRCATAAPRAARRRCAPSRRCPADPPRGCRTTRSGSSSADWRSACRGTPGRSRRS